MRRHVGAERADAGVGTHDVEVAELGDALVDGRLQLVAVTDVRFADDDPAIELLDHAGRLLRSDIARQRIAVRRDVLADVDGDDVGTLGRELHGVAAALATSGASDKGHFSVDAFP